MKKLLSAAVVSLVAIQASAAPITLTFDDVQAGTGLSTYGGFTWTAAGGWLGSDPAPASFIYDGTSDGFAHAAVSPSNYAFNYQRTLTAKWNGPGTIDFTGAWWTAIATDSNDSGVWLSFVGKLNGVQKYTSYSTGPCTALGGVNCIAISSRQATEINLNWTGIDELVVTRTARGFSEVVEAYSWAMDNFTYARTPDPVQPPVPASVPEPSVLGLVALGLAGLSMGRRRTRRA